MYSIAILVRDKAIKVFEKKESGSFESLHLKGEPTIIIGKKEPLSVIKEVRSEILSVLTENDFTDFEISLVYDKDSVSMLKTLCETFLPCASWEVRSLESLPLDPEVLLTDEYIVTALDTRYDSSKDEKIKNLLQRIADLDKISRGYDQLCELNRIIYDIESKDLSIINDIVNDIDIINDTSHESAFRWITLIAMSIKKAIVLRKETEDLRRTLMTTNVLPEDDWRELLDLLFQRRD